MRGITKGRSSNVIHPYTLRRSSKWAKFIKWVVAIGFLAAVIWCVTLYSLITRFEGLPKNGEYINADVGIVLGASLRDNKPSPALLERLDHSLQLYRSGALTSFIVTGGLDHNGATLTEAEGMRNYLMEQGVPENSIVMDSLSRSTYENLSFAQDIMEQYDWDTAIIITHNYHGSRSADIAEKLGFTPVQVSVTNSSVLNMSYHETREILAYTKWFAQKLFL